MVKTATTTRSIHPTFIGGLDPADHADLDRLVAAFVRIRSVDRLEGAIITRCWLAADMGVTVDSLDGLLKLLRWQGLVGLPDDHIVTVEDADAMRAIALGRLSPSDEQGDEASDIASAMAPKWGTWH